MPYIFKERRRPDSWRGFRKHVRHRAFLPFHVTNFVAEWIAYWLSQWVLLEVLEYAGSFSILIAVVAYFAESGQRTQARHYQAWQVINTAQGKGGNGGRVDALASLNDDGVSLVGVDVSGGAYLEGIRLKGAELRWSNLSGADLKGAFFQGANFDQATMISTNLREANLSRANLNDTNMTETDLTGADVDGAAMNNCDLSGATLTGLKNWRQISAMKGANVYGVVDAPEGFVAWAKAHGAVEVVDEPTTRPKGMGR